MRKRRFVATIYNPRRNGFNYGYIKISFDDGEIVTRSKVEAKVIIDILPRLKRVGYLAIRS